MNPAAVRSGVVVDDRVDTEHGETFDLGGVDFEAHDAESAFRSEDAGELGERGAFVGGVLKRLDRHQRIDTGVSESCVFERALAELDAIREPDSFGPSSSRGQSRCGGVDTNEGRSRPLRDPESGSARAAGEISQHPITVKPEQVEESLCFAEGEEPDVGELERELAVVGVVAPDVVERRVAAKGVVYRLVAVAHDLEDAVVGDVIVEAAGSSGLSDVVTRLPDLSANTVTPPVLAAATTGW